MVDLKPIILYSHLTTPNPIKVAIILHELGVKFEHRAVDLAKIKDEPYISINPNGRVPALEDPNTGIKVWESGACIEYLLDNYDKEGRIQYTSGQEKYDAASWKHFQMSGQGPYFGQLPWFKFYHPEKNLTSAIERYTKEIKRVWGVIDAHLAKTGKPYLVGDKCTFADLMFVSWNHIIVMPTIMGEGAAEEFEKTVPHAWAWRQKLEGRDSVKATYAEIERLQAESGEKGH